MREQTAVPRRNLPRLTGLRALAAFSVFMFHADRYWGVKPFQMGYIGVGFFFILSGFVLTWSYGESTPRKFWRRRVARIYPVYALTLIILGLQENAAYPLHLVPTVETFGLVQSWTDNRLAVNAPAWSLSAEAFFYACLPLVLLIASRVRLRTFALGAGACFGAECVTILLTQQNRLFGLTFPLVRSGEFLLGVTLALAMRQGWRVPTYWFAALGASVLAVCCFLIHPGTAVPNIAMAPVFVSVIGLAAQADIDGRRSWILARRAVVYDGEISYVFYLLHFQTQGIVASALGTGPAVVLWAFAASLVGAIVLHHAVELPAQRFILRKSRSAVQRPLNAPQRPAKLSVGV